MKKLLVLAALVSLTSAAYAAADWHWEERFGYSREGEKFRSNEFSIDLFGSYQRGSANVDDLFDEPEHGTWGGGLGANYFFTRYIGVGADVMAHDNDGKFIDNTSANLYLRVPIEAVAMAPYAFGGAVYNFDPDDLWGAQVGVGLEFRPNPYTGIFADARYAWVEESIEFSLIRAGIRFSF